MQGQAKCVSLDTISNLPLPIIENILCILPIKEAVRTSILSRNWRYNWTGIPKLVFDEDEMFDGDVSDLGDDWPLEMKLKMVSAIRQVLFLHRGPIFEFSISMDSFTNVELDQIIHDLARNKDTLKKLTLHFCYRNGWYSYKLPLSIFSFQQLTNLYFSHCAFEFNPTFSAFGSLTSLYFHSSNVSSKAILHLLSNCPLLKRLKLAFDTEVRHKWECITFHELSKCLPVIEHLSFNCRVIECCFQNYAWRELPTALVNLKCIFLFGTVLFDNSHLPLLCHVFRSSPSLEKITLTMHDAWHDPDKSKLQSNMGDCSDIWLQNLKELNILCFENSEGERRFVKLILAKSPVLKKVIIELRFEDADRQSEILRTLLQSPRASSAAEIIVTYDYKPWNDYHFTECFGPFGVQLVKKSRTVPTCISRNHCYA